MKYQPINIRSKFNLFSEQWSPKIIAQMNDYQFKIAKIQGVFVWHSHPETDETFIIIDGEMVIEFRDRIIPLVAGEMLIVPKGVEHRPVAAKECLILMVEPAGTVNTGDTDSDLTIEDIEWI